MKRMGYFMFKKLYNFYTCPLICPLGQKSRGHGGQIHTKMSPPLPPLGGGGGQGDKQQKIKKSIGDKIKVLKLVANQK